MKSCSRFGRLSLLLAVIMLFASLASCINITLPVRPTETPDPDAHACYVTDEPTEAPTQAPEKSAFEEASQLIGSRKIYTGSGEPLTDLGEEGELYYHTRRTDLFIKENGKWKRVYVLKNEGWKLAVFKLEGKTSAQLVTEGGKLSEPATDTGRSFSGWYLGMYGGAWDFDDPVTEDFMELSGFYYETPEKTRTPITYKDVDPKNTKNEGEVGMLAVFVGLTDGYTVDKPKFEAAFNGDYGIEESVRSVASYFKYASYGNISFDFGFWYYDTGLTCKEAYNIVQNGGNNFLLNIFKKIRNEDPDLMRRLDKDGDGYVDSVVFLCGEDTTKTVGDGNQYWLYGGATGTSDEKANSNTPTILRFCKLSYEEAIYSPITPGSGYGGMRVLLHEVGHLFGVSDYYDFHEYEGTLISSVGGFDMQESDVGEWNPYSRFCAGWMTPYVITEDTESVTLKIGCSSHTPDSILIPTSLGWNGTAFDEYILIDVLAPEGTNGFDWSYISEERLVEPDDPRAEGGVRIYHVDSRLLKSEWVFPAGTRRFTRITTYDEILAAVRDPGLKNGDYEIWEAYYNTNGVDPYIEGDSRWYHLIDIVPRDGTEKFRVCTPLGWAIYTFLSYSDLFSTGDVFSMENCEKAFADGPYMNNGGTLDWKVTVEHYDSTAHEAIITVTKVG